MRTAIINSYENEGFRVLNFETLVRSLRLAWLKRLCSGEEVGYKSYLNHLLKPHGGSFLFSCDYDPKDFNISNDFYEELIKFWADFSHVFSDAKTSSSIIWNNKNIGIHRKAVFYKSFFQ